MTKKIFTLTALCAAVLASNAQGQTSSDQNQGTTSGTSQGTSGSDSRFDSGKHLSATGRMGHHEVRATKLIGSDVKSSSGEELGTVNDVILNPASGRIDFAVLSLSSSSTGNSATSGTAAGSSTASLSTASSSGTGKLAAVPWSMLRPSGATGYGATITSTSGGSQTFVFSGEASKLQSAPSFDQSNWPDINEPTWRQNIYSHFGMQPGSSTGGATSPGGTGSSSGNGTSPSSTPPDSGKP